MAIGELLADRWGLTVQRVDVLDGGMNSRTWLVIADDVQLVVKSVEASGQGFAFGLELAARLQAGGVATGAPVASLDGRFAERMDDREVAVLQYVDGHEFGLEPDDLRAIGTTLARVHALAPAEAGDLEQWLQIVTELDAYLDHEPWIRPAVRKTLDEVRDLGARMPLTWAGLHGDPAPEAFLRRPDGEIALIDWGAAMTGPALYDLASAALYVGGSGEDDLDHCRVAQVVAAYGRTPEVEAGLPTFRRLRYAVQAAYFAWRCATDVRTGISDAAENRKGLADARQAFGL